MSYSDIKIKSNSKFLKIEAGAPQEIRIIDSAPHEKLVHSDKAGTTPCTGEGCFKCMDGDVARQRFVTNVYNHTQKRVQIYEYGASIATSFKSIDQSLKEENKSILDVDLKIEAEGSNMTKRYKVIQRTTAKPLPDNIIRIKIDGEGQF